MLLGLRAKEGPFDQGKIFLRALERLPWHDILEVMGKKRIMQLLTPEQISKLRFPEQRRRYERIRKILQGEPVSLSGWDPQHRETYRRTLFYLTGGTALSRHYSPVRYSDDLDFFVNRDPMFSNWAERLYSELEIESRRGSFAVLFDRVVRYEDYIQLFVEQQSIYDIGLKKNILGLV
ncbi:MAG: nucleotidyl transferase AbiEii/AbiGii toxin family protein [Thermodesulfobacteriota bacterium]|nr:nucleotidyl transferase AbiEii/AbiGii toxin family protein [Thermodesulfobacteriota bacterium]